MFYLKLSLLFIIAASSYAQEDSFKPFSTKECLDARYNLEVKNDTNYFGLVQTKLNLVKEQCNIKVNYKKIVDVNFKIDICRQPIHMKVTKWKNESVSKRNGECSKGHKTDYCQYMHELGAILNDFGLIYASGSRENLKEDHGKVYCVSELLKKYLAEGYLFSSVSSTQNIFSHEKKMTKPDNTSAVYKTSESITNDKAEEQIGVGDESDKTTIDGPMF